ncbi:MAG: hypothetical protein DRJ50_01395, partial [Actinobacteria bacterium]
MPVRSLLFLALVTIAACGGAGSETGESSGTVESSASVVPSTDLQPVGVQPQGFTTITARITKADGEVCEVCLWLADDAAERGRGLMGVTDLGEPSGMAFRFEEAVNGNFFMFQTPTPLSIAWFAPDGSIVGVADMDPCLETNYADCERYSPGSLYSLVIETFEGDLADLGIGPGSVVQMVEGSE